MSQLHDTIVALETEALRRWGAGDPDGYLDISAADLSYFDPMQPARIDGLEQLRSLYGQFRGKILIDRQQIVHPRVQAVGEAAILTFQFISEGSEGAMHWNATEVYARTGGAWKIVHTHWSFTAAASRPQEPSAGN